jgi:hypothetical protein
MGKDQSRVSLGRLTRSDSLYLDYSHAPISRSGKHHEEKRLNQQRNKARKTAVFCHSIKIPSDATDPAERPNWVACLLFFLLFVADIAQVRGDLSFRPK